MIEIPLATVPNQTLSVTLDGSVYDLALYAINGVMAVDVVRDGAPIVTGFRAVAGYPIIPYEYLENGNFIFVTDNEEYPDYLLFGTTQSLIFATEAELGVIRGGA